MNTVKFGAVHGPYGRKNYAEYEAKREALEERGLIVKRVRLPDPDDRRVTKNYLLTGKDVKAYEEIMVKQEEASIIQHMAYLLGQVPLQLISKLDRNASSHARLEKPSRADAIRNAKAQVRSGKSNVFSQARTVASEAGQKMGELAIAQHAQVKEQLAALAKKARK